MNVPLLDLNAQNLPLEEELFAAFKRVLHSGRFILGPEVEAFEQKIAEMAGAKYGIGVSSGTDALLLALMTLDIGPGDEVLCPSFTFFATAGCIARVGATPVFVDAREDTFNLDVEDARRKVSSRTKAIIPVHLFGQAADMDGVMAIAKEHELSVIEDGAQALGAKYNGIPVGGIGDFGTFSFFPSKNLGGFGDGGMLVTNDDTLAAKASILRTHGSKPKYYHKYVGGNFRLDPLQAALLMVKLPFYDTYTRKRQKNAAFYDENLFGLANTERSSGIFLPKNTEGEGHIWNQYTIRVPSGRRNALKQYLAENGIESEIYYPVPMDSQECFVHLHQKGRCPTTATLADEVLSVPIFPEITREQKEVVVKTLTSFITAPASA